MVKGVEKVYAVSRNGSVINECFTTLKGACEEGEVSYSQAQRGRRLFIKGDKVTLITEMAVMRIKGRENNLKR